MSPAAFTTACPICRLPITGLHRLVIAACAASNEPRAASCAGTAGLCLTTSADAAAVPCGSALRMLADDEFQTAAGGLRMPALHPAIEREQVRQVARSCLNPAAAEWWLDQW